MGWGVCRDASPVCSVSRMWVCGFGEYGEVVRGVLFEDVGIMWSFGILGGCRVYSKHLIPQKLNPKPETLKGAIPLNPKPPKPLNRKPLHPEPQAPNLKPQLKPKPLNNPKP